MSTPQDPQIQQSFSFHQLGAYTQIPLQHFMLPRSSKHVAPIACKRLSSSQKALSKHSVHATATAAFFNQRRVHLVPWTHTLSMLNSFVHAWFAKMMLYAWFARMVCYFLRAFQYWESLLHLAATLQASSRLPKTATSRARPSLNAQTGEDQLPFSTSSRLEEHLLKCLSH